MSGSQDAPPASDPTRSLLSVMREHPALGLTGGYLLVSLLGTSSRFVFVYETEAELTWVVPHENLARIRVVAPETAS